VQKTQQRNVALADIKARVVSVRNIGKLTKALQLVATAQLRTARRQLVESRNFADQITESWQLPGSVDALTTKPDMTKGPEHLIAFATDRSLCGSVNNQLSKAMRPQLTQANAQGRKDLTITVLGEKGRTALGREYAKYFSNVFTDIAKCKELTFKQSLTFTDTLLQSNSPHGAFHYNYFINAMAFEPRRVPFTDTDTMVANTQFINSHSWQRDHENYKNYHEMLLSASMFNFWAENVACEISTRMSAMTTSSQNAEEIAFLLNRFYNRTRQARITSELIEINSGATVIAESDK
jgi:ATP synthase F1 gamma subunit